MGDFLRLSIVADTPLPASAWVERWLAPVQSNETLLDWACGSGRNSQLALTRGYRVTALDRNADSLARLSAAIERQQIDLEQAPWPPLKSFDVVLVCNYLYRQRLDLLAGLVKPGGLLLYETFAAGNERFGKPSNPEYLLKRGELIDLARRQQMNILAYEDIEVVTPKPACIQRIAARRNYLATDLATAS